MANRTLFYIVTSLVVLSLLVVVYMADRSRRDSLTTFLRYRPNTTGSTKGAKKDGKIQATESTDSEASLTNSEIFMYPVKQNARDYLTEEEALKGDPLVDINQTVSLKTSTVSLFDNRTYQVGDFITLSVTLRNGYNGIRSQGGDDLRVRIYNDTLKAYGPGHVTDHKNGSYTAVVRANWPGKQTISVYLANPREIIRTTYYIRQKLAATRRTLALFSSRNHEEETFCHPQRKWLQNYSEICNFTLMNGGASWYCGKPKNQKLLCEDWEKVTAETPFPKLPMTDVEKKILGLRWGLLSGVQVDVKGPMANRSDLPACYGYPKQDLWNKKELTGYFYNDTWYLQHCNGASTFDLKHCLRDTHLVISGDSTTRDWYKYLLKHLSCQPLTDDWYKQKWHQRSACNIPSINFKMEWLPHAQPFYVGESFELKRYSLNALSNQMNEINSDDKVVYILHMYMHMLFYHHSVFQDRMRLASKSVKNLLMRNKHAKVMIKGPHTYMNTALQRIIDYYIYLYRDILYEEFRGLHDRIVYMDQKDMTISKAIESYHPPETIQAQATRQMFAYMCE